MKVVGFSAIKSKSIVNDEAADMLQDVVDKLRRGEQVGVAWATVNKNGQLSNGWHAPKEMGNDIYAAVSCLANAMITSYE